MQYPQPRQNPPRSSLRSCSILSLRSSVSSAPSRMPCKNWSSSHSRCTPQMGTTPSCVCIHAEAVEGELKPGDDVLFLVVAGDIREHVKATFSELLDRIKAEAVIKQEFTE